LPGHSFRHGVSQLRISFVTVSKARLDRFLKAGALSVKLIKRNVLLLKRALQVTNKTGFKAFESTELAFVHHLIVSDLLGLALVDASNASKVGFLVQSFALYRHLSLGVGNCSELLLLDNVDLSFLQNLLLNLV